VLRRRRTDTTLDLSQLAKRVEGKKTITKLVVNGLYSKIVLQAEVETRARLKSSASFTRLHSIDKFGTEQSLCYHRN
jgi:hypothetical protein